MYIERPNFDMIGTRGLDLLKSETRFCSRTSDLAERQMQRKIWNMNKIVFPDHVFRERLEGVMHNDLNAFRQPPRRRKLGR